MVTTVGDRVDVLSVDDAAWDTVVAKGPHDIFHTAGFHRYAKGSGEGEPYLVVVTRQGKGLAWPYLLRPVREVPGLESSDARDVHSVYGYPGPIVWGTADSEFLASAFREVVGIWRDQQVVSAFTRFHPLIRNEAAVISAPWPISAVDGSGGVVAGGPTISIDLSQGTEAARRGYARDLARDIIQSRKRGLTTVHDQGWDHLSTFTTLYHDTMVRSGAAQYYFFGYEDFVRLRDQLGGRLHLLVTMLDGVVASAGLFTELGETAEWYLVGTNQQFSRLSPSKVLVDDAMQWASERGNRVLHLGGGRGGREDTLLWFKGRFGPRRHPFHTGRWVLDAARYSELAAARRERLDGHEVQETFFPVYRAPAASHATAPRRVDQPRVAITWRYIRAAEEAALADLLARIDHTYFNPHLMTVDGAAQISRHEGRDVYILAYDGDTPIGYGMLRGWDEGYEVPSLGIGIRRDYERRGFGRQVMDVLHEIARERAAPVVRLRVHPDNVGAAALYRSLGYQEAGIERAEILMVKKL